VRIPLQCLALVAAFSAGVLTQELRSRYGSHAEAVGNQGIPAAVSPPPAPIPAIAGGRIGEPGTPPKADEPRWLRLQSEVVEALLAGGGLDRRLGRMGLTGDQVAEVTRVQAEATAALKSIEKDHAQVVSDDRGRYVVIDPFPMPRRTWLIQTEEKLRDMLGDDRASVIARMIAFADNDEEVGFYRREIFITEPPNAGEKWRIEERTVNDAGEHIDSDFEVVDERSQGRWGHVLDFEPK